MDIRRGRPRPPIEMAMATTHTVRTIHHTGSEDGPPAPGAGNVRTQRATCGTRLGAISTSTTAPLAATPGAEGAHIAFGDGQKQRLVARAAVHVLTVASTARKSFTTRREFSPGPPRPRQAALLADGAGHGAVSAGSVLRGRARFECWLFVRRAEKLDRFTTEPGAGMIGVAFARLG